MRRNKKPPSGPGRAAKADTVRATSSPHYIANRSCLPVYNQRGRICGEITGDTLRKSARRNHMLQRPPAWGWDAAIIEQAEAAGCRWTEVRCDGRVYRASLADFDRYGFTIDRGYGRQKMLPLNRWQIRPVGEPIIEQLSLFPGGGL